jgi:hypothetical protein
MSKQVSECLAKIGAMYSEDVGTFHFSLVFSFSVAPIEIDNDNDNDTLLTVCVVASISYIHKSTFLLKSTKQLTISTLPTTGEQIRAFAAAQNAVQLKLELLVSTIIKQNIYNVRILSISRS